MPSDKSNSKIPTGFEELNYDEEFYFQWHITNECNLRCKHCYHESYLKEDINISKLTQIADQLCNALDKWKKKGSFSITGGEPLMNPEILFQLLDNLENRNVDKIDLLTNGTLLTDNIILKLKEYKKLRRFQLSLEGLRATNDKIRGVNSYDRTLDAIDNLKRHGLVVSIMMTIGRHNKDEVIPLADELAKHDVDVFIIDRFIPEGQGSALADWVLSPGEIREVYTKAYEYFKKTLKPRFLLYRTLFCLLNPEDPHIGAICSIGNNALTIMPNGDVLPCRRLPIVLGNLFETTLYDIWYTSPLLWEIRNPGNLKGKCNNCEYIPICRGCRAVAYAVKGDYLAEDPQCWKET
ncbi:MAG TPA: radical SAM protein [Bacteroidales bacterium]|nr:radical SAM protein [Bacteroidales bacterium]